MKKFTFPLRSVETVRSLEELRSREVFIAAVHTFREAEEARRQARTHRERFEQSLLSSRQGGLHASEQIAYTRAYELELTREKQSMDAQAKARQSMDQARVHWVSAKRGLRVIENLKTKARFAHRQMIEREEQAAMDDRTNAMVGRAPALAHE